MRDSALWGECCTPRIGYKTQASDWVFSGSTTKYFVFVLAAVWEGECYPFRISARQREGCQPGGKKTTRNRGIAVSRSSQPIPRASLPSSAWLWVLYETSAVANLPRTSFQTNINRGRYASPSPPTEPRLCFASTWFDRLAFQSGDVGSRSKEYGRGLELPVNSKALCGREVGAKLEVEEALLTALAVVSLLVRHRSSDRSIWR